MNETNTQILLRSRPTGFPSENNFEIVHTPVPQLREGEVLRRTMYLSLDPYMRGRMNAGKSYAEAANVGETMPGGTVSQVIDSKDPRFRPGDIVLGYDGWQAFGCGDGKSLRKLNPAEARVSWSLGVLGMPGLTAYVGLLDIGKPKAGETVVVSSAAGAVGSVAGQIAKIKGCRVVGTAGSDQKCAFVKQELGFDECINYKSTDVRDALGTACPDGIDVYFDNVGGAVLDAVLHHINLHARIPLIGMISQYNDTSPAPGPNLSPLLVNRALIQGMIVMDHVNRTPDFLRDVSQWLREGKLKVREDIVDGLENAPRAFLGLLKGENTGKRIVSCVGQP